MPPSAGRARRRSPRTRPGSRNGLPAALRRAQDGRTEPVEGAAAEGCGGTRTPRHIAIIMDGNGRWAAERGKTRLAGHRAGAEAVRGVVTAAAELGVKVLTLYVFSSENWSRPAGEVKGLFRLLKMFVQRETPELLENGIRLRTIGRLDDLPADALAAVRRAEAETAGGERMTLCVALNYGSRDEITDAARTLARDAVAGRISPEEIDRREVERRLHTAGLPQVDLLIRTGGELRLSNFLLWQVSYAELYFTPVCWPDFKRENLRRAIRAFARRERRFGGV